MNNYLFDEVCIGDTEQFLFFIDDVKMQKFREITGDENPLHHDKDFALCHGFQDIVVYAQLTASALSTLAGMYLPGKQSIIHTLDSAFLNPVYLSNSPLKVTGIVKEKDDRFRTITVKYEIFDSTSKKVCKGNMRIGFSE